MDMWLLKDIVIVVGLVVMAILLVIGAIGVGFNIQQIRDNIAIWGLTWFEVIAGILAVAFWVVVLKLIWRLNKFEQKKPLFSAYPVSFPIGGWRVGKLKDLSAPRKGYAKIAVINRGGFLDNCIGNVEGIWAVDIIKGQVSKKKLSDLASNSLSWENGRDSLGIPNDGLPRMINLAYLDQERPGVWQLAIEESHRQDYITGWYKIDIVISSVSPMPNPLRVEVALGFGDREFPPSGLNLWPWDKWYESIQDELKQALDKEGSPN